ncbi:hypothetical protein MVLG_05604 [Microbotryum lychnidis-dioicae p1A1 Lamole]|uniref:Uncharacterized protein n=1 Tax=Microbotryum lychnidis-dioicae (strain p1A1 Lamole / MvSl-1064) TaxID=683840 RepID=U5HER4_USTV1|nr:hypothetical protein MVLG_05604 [Microbotryum lychnidis-dioicae p1A1 Lamole]|eukprot:KDE03912.1 hypothetical protein MVLG_05604 [Microbotryum lychnidis-dioicae p1A1 Lamole]
MAFISPFYHPYIIEDMIAPGRYSSGRPRVATEYDLCVSPAMLSSALPLEVPRPPRLEITARAFRTTARPLHTYTASSLSSRTKHRSSPSASSSILGPLVHEFPSRLGCSISSRNLDPARDLTMSRRSSSSSSTIITGKMSPPHSPGVHSPLSRAVTEAEVLAARMLPSRKAYASKPASPTSPVSVAPIPAPNSPAFSSASSSPSPPPLGSPTMKYKKPDAELDRWLQALSVAQSRADSRLP